MTAIESALALSNEMARAIRTFGCTAVQKPAKPKYIYLGEVEQLAWEATFMEAGALESFPDRSPKREFMGVEVIFVRDKERFLAVGI